MIRSSVPRLVPILLTGAVLFSACDSGTAPNDSGTTLSLYLTDAPGDVAAVWVDVSDIYFQGGPGGRLSLLDEPTGLIELTELVDRTRALAMDLSVEPGTYSQLRLVLAGAVLESTDGKVYSFGGAQHPDGLTATGDLLCPGCTTSGLKVKLANDEVEVSEGGNAIVLDFDVSQSFGHAAGNSGKWVMKPVIHAVHSEGGDGPDGPGDSAGTSEIRGTVVLVADAAGSPTTIPQCPEGRDRSLSDFVPWAVAETLTDGDGEHIVRAGAVGDAGTFAIRNLQADTYALAHQPELLFDAFRLVWQASVEPASVALTAGQNAEGVVYAIRGATCEAITAG